MPPFKTGFMKRKIQSDIDNNTPETPDEHESYEESFMVRQIAEDKDDATDSEHEEETTSSGGEQEVVSETEYSEGSQNSKDEKESDDSGTEGESESTDSRAKVGGARGVARRKHSTHTNNKGKGTQNLNDSVDKLASQIEETNVSIQPVVQIDEYSGGDTSDEEDRRTTVGSVPRWWYDEYPHQGYDLDGRRVLKPNTHDAIDNFLRQCSDPEFWRTVRDPETGQDVVLSARDLDLLSRLRARRVPDPHRDEYEPWVEWFSRSVLATPVRAFPDHKRSFLPSRDEQRAVARLVHALRMGWTKTRKQLAEERRNKKEKKYYDLWGAGAVDGEGDGVRGIHKHIPAPRRPPPAHAESYNPPPEYLLDEKEMKEWNKLSETPWKRKHTFLPTRHSNLRAVPAYPRLVRERFLRCLDLYLAPRAVKMRLTIRPESLVPQLPAPRDLQPFPTSEALRLTGHTAPVRCCDFDPSGQYIVSGSDDATLKIWETSSGRCLRTISLEEPALRVSWAPVRALSLIAVAAGPRLLLLSPGADVGAHRTAQRTDELFDEPPPQHDSTTDERTARAVTWERVRPEQWARGVRLSVRHFNPLAHVSWHARGDYVATTVREGGSRAVVVHQVSRRRSQLPFSRAKGLVQCAVFHPHRPHLFVATQRAVRIYDLVKQELIKKLITGAQWISTLALHPKGDNLLVASYDRKCMWFDLELSSQPYQTLRLHGRAVRAVAFSARYPLFATAGDDPYLVVSHATVYNDLLQNPLLVPLKQLGVGAGREPCVLDLRWHPAQPWLLAAAADHTLRLYS